MARWQYIVVPVILTCAFIMVAGCGGGGGGASSTSGTAAVFLADGPGSGFQAVYVTIQSIQICPTDGAWLTLYAAADLAQAGVTQPINFTDLLNKPAGLGNQIVPAGTYSQVRLMVDTTPGACYVIDSNGVQQNVTIPSGAQTGIKLVGGPFTIAAGAVNYLMIDFHAANSVHQLGNGNWQMKPTVSLTVLPGPPAADLGGISGTVDPLPAATDEVWVQASGTTALGTVTNAALVDTTTGAFTIDNLPAGTYNITVTRNGTPVTLATPVTADVVAGTTTALAAAIPIGS
jgi:hypothetical protein